MDTQKKIPLIDKIKYYNTGEAFFKDNFIFLNRAVEECEPHMHAHDFIEIAYVAFGQGIHTLGHTEFSVSRGDLFLINYDTPHEFRSISKDPSQTLIVYNCVFKPEFIDRTLVECRDFSDITCHLTFNSLFPDENTKPSEIHLLGSDISEIETLYKKMFDEYSEKNEGYLELLKVYVIELLIKVFRLYKKSMKFELEPNLSKRKIIQNMLQYIHENFAHEITLYELSMKAFLSRSYFSRVFKEYTGMTVSEYTQKLRIDEACRLLRETDMTLMDIALEVGYKDLKFFKELFRRIVDKSPMEYRKSGSNLILR